MLIQEIMTREVETVRPSDNLQLAAQRMKDLDVGSLPVCDGERLIGMLTDRDITVVSTAEGADPSQTPVGDVMTPEVTYCYDNQPVEEAAALMKEKKLRRLVVLNRNKRLVGLVSLGDIAEKTGDDILSGQVLEKVSEPEGQQPAESRRSNKVPDIPSETHL